MKFLLFAMAREKLRREYGKRITPERFIYDAHEWNEQMVSLYTIQHEYEDITIDDKLSDVLEDYCLAILSERSRPIWAHEPKRLESKTVGTDT